MEQQNAEQQSAPVADNAGNAPPPPPPTGSGQKKIKVNRLIYRGTTGGIYKIWFKQFLLSLVTLGIYKYWGKTNIRRYLIGAMELDGDRFEYHGTGKELMKGAVKIVPFYVIFMIIVVAAQAAMGVDENAQSVTTFLMMPPLFYFIAIATYSGFRYRINRISWRGIRARMGGSALRYGGYYMKGTLIKFFTLGFMSPSVDLGRWEYRMNNVSFGTVPFKAKCDPANLRQVNTVTLLLAPFTLFLSRLWYHAALQRESMRGLSLGPLRFRSTLTGLDFFLFFLGNFALVIFTLGFGAPLVLARRAQIYSRFVAIGGDLDDFKTAQVPEGIAGDAEGLQSLLDIDVGFIGA
ncbi:MAG: DUF898 family protein [Alphaproteobacteria bacterium]|nr:DUF898 family protein [Alphaproteobacteria bacterium]